MTDRYDHRTADARAADAEEDQVLDSPLQTGASELRAEVAETAERGDLENDPLAPPAPRGDA